MKRKKVYILTLFVTLMMLGVVIGMRLTSVLGTVNQMKITKEELVVYAKNNENRVANQFTKKYNINSYGSNFWSQNFDGESPLVNLYEESLENAIRDKLLFEFAKEIGVKDVTSFKEVSESYEESAHNLSLADYMESQIVLIENKIKEKLLDKYPPTQIELKESFDSLEDKYKAEEYSIEAIEINVADIDLQELNTKSEIIVKDKNMDEQLNMWKSIIPKSELTPITLNSLEIQKEDLYHLSIGELLLNQKKGGVIEGFRDNQYFYMVSQEGGGLLEFEEAPQMAENKYINDLFLEMIDKKYQAQELKMSNQAMEKFMRMYK